GEAAGNQAAASELRIAVSLAHFFGFLRNVEGVGRRGLHPEGNFGRLYGSFELRITALLAHVRAIQRAEEIQLFALLLTCQSLIANVLQQLVGIFLLTVVFM